MQVIKVVPFDLNYAALRGFIPYPVFSDAVNRFISQSRVPRRDLSSNIFSSRDMKSMVLVLNRDF